MNGEKTNDERCPECGGAVAGGRAGCQALFEELGARAFTDARLGSVQQLVVDAYCLQHPDDYCHSAKSYAAHITRLCIGLERGGGSNLYAAIPKWLSGNVNLLKPALPDSRGELTIVEVHAARDIEQHKKLVLDWARSVWTAYSSQQATARQWIDAALAVGGRSANKKSSRR